ncbi:hypothetical protein [Streptomyces sp. NPDC058335]|uniref:hypothetical protein n=1 Tax=Streptomyces sp. NPDC058335 TaxID=3346451 RepID=UPI00364FB879
MRTDDADAACALVERELTALTGFLRERRLTHVDAHFRNILTDGGSTSPTTASPSRPASGSPGGNGTSWTATGTTPPPTS